MLPPVLPLQPRRHWTNGWAGMLSIGSRAFKGFHKPDEGSFRPEAAIALRRLQTLFNS